MNYKRAAENRVWQYLFFSLFLIGLYFTSRVNYLLFHSLAEIMSIVVAFSFFAIAWNSREYIRNPYILFIGIAYLFIASLDLMHTLSYAGMQIFTDYDYYANQLWIAARYMESLTLLSAFYFLARDRQIRAELQFFIYLLITGLAILSIFVWKTFPVCFVDGSGLTPFKKISEYIICLILCGSIFLLHLYRKRFDPFIYWVLLLSLICTIISELAFTFYISNYGFSNLVGHYFKIFSFYLVYKALIETGIRNPYDLIFRELSESNDQLEREVRARKESEKEREALIKELQAALSDVRKLSGLLPICSHCKKIRDSGGDWKHIDVYVQEHSEAVFSHGVCRECAVKYYPGLNSAKTRSV